MRPVYRGPVPVYTTSRGQSAQVSEEYGFYMKSLILRLGEYCSYCEVLLGANLAIEHIISKSKVPQLETSWSNFILACPNCNSSKGNVVDLTNLDNYYWPSDTSYKTFDKFVYFMDIDNFVKIRAAAVDPIADATINLTKLNRFNPVDNKKLSDRRVFNRTAAWNAADNLATRLNGYYAALGAAADADPAVQLLKRQIKSAAIARGFWSVWMTTFKSKPFYNDITRNNLLCELFVKTFPGTNYPLAPNCANMVPGDYHGGIPT